jgi:hypothetical protein
VDRNLDAVDQLKRINEHANDLLETLMRYHRGDEEAVRLLDSSNVKDPRELALKAMGEIRNQLRLQLEIFKCLCDPKAVQEFQEKVLTAIGEASPDVKDKILFRLNEKQALRRAVGIG